jgi:hypothetical protein
MKNQLMERFGKTLSEVLATYEKFASRTLGYGIKFLHLFTAFSAQFSSISDRLKKTAQITSGLHVKWRIALKLNFE